MDGGHVTIYCEQQQLSPSIRAKVDSFFDYYLLEIRTAFFEKLGFTDTNRLFTHVSSGENGEPIVELEVVRNEGHVRVGRDHDGVAAFGDFE